MNIILTLGFAFVLIFGGLLGMGYSKSGQVDPLLAGGTVFGIFLMALYFMSAARRKAAEKGRRKQAAAQRAAYQKETADFLISIKK